MLTLIALRTAEKDHNGVILNPVRGLIASVMLIADTLVAIQIIDILSL